MAINGERSFCLHVYTGEKLIVCVYYDWNGWPENILCPGHAINPLPQLNPPQRNDLPFIRSGLQPICLSSSCHSSEFHENSDAVFAEQKNDSSSVTAIT